MTRSIVGIHCLGLYPLSVVLSFLEETEGVRLLLTRKHYCQRILVRYRTRVFFSELVVVNAPKKKQPYRHRFGVCPVQDPTVLLERLNTRRLAKRRRELPNANHRKNNNNNNMTTVQLAEWEWKYCNCKLDSRYELLHFDDHFDKRTLLTSYPRSGNTLLRTLLERTTGVVTGSDTRPNRTLSKSLALQHNLVGEGVIGGASLVKTHYPERSGYRSFQAHRAVVLVRNPYDAIDSYWNLCLTNTHTESVTEDVYERFQDKFVGLVQNEIRVWLDFHKHWLSQDDMQVLLVRFEDLIVNPQQEMCRVLKFIQDTSSLSHFWMNRIRHACNGNNTTSLGSYRPRSADSGRAAVGKSLCMERYSQDLLTFMEQAAKQGDRRNFIQEFGYSIADQNFPDNFVNGTVATLDDFVSRSSGKMIQINAGLDLRPPNDPYGRAMTRWRKQYTNDDTEPFPTVART